jgi:hypothetical protein
MSIITLCGSTKFKREYERVQEALTLQGHIVISVGLFGHQKAIELEKSTKEMLDEMHLRKIDMADEIYVVDAGGYIGESTDREVKYAGERGKAIRFYSCDPQFAEPLPMSMYDAAPTESKTVHTVLLKFQYGEHHAQVVTTIEGNICGTEVVSSFERDSIVCLTAPVDHPINIRHCTFDNNIVDDADATHRYVNYLHLYHPTRSKEVISIESLPSYLVGVEIIDYESPRYGDEDDFYE